ncbi:hypothetical protein [Mesorhizobium sp. Root552]|uniref:hypothetical protein n=1 Tax=Mesorhizobium sp. Root552 TaxID=1736555 RepID=UPI0009EB75F6|nr:hypothetical protein [Mesorhizobium sp. Root552]
MTTSLHIETARAALARAAWARGEKPAYDEEAIIDLLADMRHWCRNAGVDYDRCDQCAASHYRNEIGSVS